MFLQTIQRLIEGLGEWAFLLLRNIQLPAASRMVMPATTDKLPVLDLVRNIPRKGYVRYDIQPQCNVETLRLERSRYSQNLRVLATSKHLRQLEGI